MGTFLKAAVLIWLLILGAMFIPKFNSAIAPANASLVQELANSCGTVGKKFSETELLNMTTSDAKSKVSACESELKVSFAKFRKEREEEERISKIKEVVSK